MSIVFILVNCFPPFLHEKTYETQDYGAVLKTQCALLPNSYREEASWQGWWSSKARFLELPYGEFKEIICLHEDGISDRR